MEEKDLKGVLEEYVVTANSGKYNSWEEINSKFPELKDYDSGLLEEYVVTANSGKYNSWDEINSKFPEFFEGSGGASANFTEGSEEPSKQSTTTTSEAESKPSETAGEDKPLKRKAEDLQFDQVEGRLAEQSYRIDSALKEIEKQYSQVDADFSEIKQRLDRASEGRAVPLTEDPTVADSELIQQYNQALEARNSVSEQYNKLAKDKYKLDVQRKKVQQLKDENIQEVIKTAWDNLPFSVSQGAQLIGGAISSLQNMAASFLADAATSEGLTEEEVESIQDPKIREKLKADLLEIQKEKQELFGKAIELQEQSQETAKAVGAVTSLKDIESVTDVLDFATYSIGEQLPQFAQAFVSLGLGTFIQERGSIQSAIVQRLMEEGKTLEEALESEEVNKASTDISAAAIAGLDLLGLATAGATKLIKPLAKASLATKFIKTPTQKLAVGITGEIGTEVAQESIAKGGEAAALEEGFLKGAASLSLDEILEVGAKSFFGIAPIATVNAFTSKGEIKQPLLKSVSEDSDRYNVIKGVLQAKVNLGEITQEEANTRINELNQDINAYNQIKDFIPENNIEQGVQLQKEYEALEEQKKETTGGFKKFITSEQAKIEEKLLDLAGIKKDEEGNYVKTQPTETKTEQESQVKPDQPTTEQTPVSEEIEQKPQEDALQEVQGETEESVLRDQGVEETREEATQEIPEQKKEEFKVGDTVSVTVDTIKDGETKSTTQKAEITAVNEDGTFNLKKGSLTYKNVTPKKIKPFVTKQSVESETEGLTQKEAAKQGVDEIVTAYKDKIKQAKAKARQEVKDVKNKAKEKLDQIKEARDILSGVVNDYLPKNAKVSKAIAKAIANAKTPRSIERLAEKIDRYVEKTARKEKLDSIKEKQARVKKRLPKLTNQEQAVKSLLNIDLSKIEDIKLLSEIEKELDSALKSPVAKLNPERINTLLDKVEQKLDPSKNTTNLKKVKEKVKSLGENEDKSTLDKIRDINRLYTSLNNALKTEEITQDEFDKASEILDKEVEKYSKNALEEAKELNKESKEGLDRLDMSNYTEEEKAEIRRLKQEAGRRGDLKNAIKLNDIVEELELGYIPTQQINDYIVDTYSERKRQELAPKINARTSLDNVRNKLASLMGLGREGRVRGGNLSKIGQDALDILQRNVTSYWDNLFGLGRTKDISIVIGGLLDSQVAKTAREIKDLQRKYNRIVYGTFGNVSKKGRTAIVMMRKQGSWEVTDGMDSDYWSELLYSEDPRLVQQRESYGKEIDLIEKVYKSLPKKNGKLDYESYFNNLKGRKKRLNDFLTRVAKENSEKQKIANQRQGKAYVERDSQYYLTDIVLGLANREVETDLSEMVQSGLSKPSLESKTGITRVPPNVRAISTDLDRIFSKQITNTIRDYNLSTNVRAVVKTFQKLANSVEDPNARALLNQIKPAIVHRLGSEYGMRPADGIRRAVGKLLGAARSYYLNTFSRVLSELISEIIRAIPVTKVKYLPKAIKEALGAKAKGINLVRVIMEKTNSTVLEKSYLEGSLPDVTGSMQSEKTFLGKLTGLVDKASSAFMSASSNVVAPFIWLTNFKDAYKKQTGKEIDIDKFLNDPEYLEKNRENIENASAFADTIYAQVQGGRTRFSKRQQVPWIGTPISNLKDILTGSVTTGTNGFRGKYLDSFSVEGMVNSFLSTFAGIEALMALTASRGVIHGENMSRSKGGELLLLTLASGTVYTLSKDIISDAINEYFDLDDDKEEDDRTFLEKLSDSALNNISFLSIGRYGQSAMLAAKGLLLALKNSVDKEQFEQIAEVTKNRYDLYPLQFGYTDAGRAIDQFLPFMGELISTVTEDLPSGLADVHKIYVKKEQGKKLDMEEEQIIAAMGLLSDMTKLMLISKGTQIPMQRKIDTILTALDKIREGKKISKYEFETLNSYNYIDLIDNAIEEAKVKK